MTDQRRVGIGLQAMFSISATLATAWAVAASPTEKTGSGEMPAAPTLEEAKAIVAEASEQDRQRFTGQTYEQFLEKVYKEPFEGGKYIVNGDTPILNEKLLREFFETSVAKQPEALPTELIVHRAGGTDAAWDRAAKTNLTYCVSRAFGTRYDQVVADLEAAAGAWEAVANVDFIHQSDEDDACDAANANVVFDVRPVNVDGDYLARAFFPNEPRAARNVLIDESSFNLDPQRTLNVRGILRHELGHTLGFRHEHTRPSSGACFEDENWRPLTDYDAFSVMHYPQCNGLGDWSLVLTSRDSSGSACLYGAAAGFTIDTSICTPAQEPAVPAAGTPKTETFGQQVVAVNEENNHGPFRVVPGTVFKAVMTGPSDAGDPDLYVRFDQEPQTFNFACRPFLVGAEETCVLDVPAGATNGFVMVRGYTAGRYDLEVTFTPDGA
ncbi:MAG: matrixin family metalloprotease [Pseudomonadota bacterium]